MEIQDLLDKLTYEGVQIEIKNGEIFVFGKRDEVSDRTLELIAEHRIGLKKFLLEAETTNDKLLNHTSDWPTDSLELTFGQKRMWFNHRLRNGSPEYNMIFSWKLQGRVNLEALQDAIQHIVDRHPILRTVYKETGGRPRQEPSKKSRFELEVLTCKEGTLEDYSDSTTNRIAYEESTSFDLSTDLMLRGTVLQRDTETATLILTFHHIAFDGWSEGIFVRELNSYYKTLVSGGKIEFNSQPMSYLDYAALQAKNSPVNYDGLRYWSDKLDGAPVRYAMVPQGIAEHEPSTEGSIFYTSVDAGVAESFRTFCSENRIHHFAGLFACFAVVLAKRSGVTDLVIGTPISGRVDQRFAETIGFFVNTLPFRFKLENGMSLLDFLRQSQETALDAFSNQHIPYDLMVAKISPEREYLRNPFIQTMFALQNNDHGCLDLIGVLSTPLPETAVTVAFDLHLDVYEVLGELKLEWRFRRDLFSIEDIATISNGFSFLMNLAATQTFLILSEIELPGIYSGKPSQSLNARNKACGINPTNFESLGGWRDVFNDTYSSIPKDAFELDFTGWNSSYSGELIAASELLEWRDQTIERIGELMPKIAFEVGCGTGLLLYGLYSLYDRYCGIDISENVIDRHQSYLQRNSLAKASTELVSQDVAAWDLTRVTGGDSVDTVIINSVSQYFPDQAYLDQVLDKAIGCIGNGSVFIGDVRNLDSLDSFYLSVLHSRDQEVFRVGRLERIVEELVRMRSAERELAISPDYFGQLQSRYPSIRGVEIRAKGGCAENEMTKFRYDVILYIGTGTYQASEYPLPEYDQDSGVSSFGSCDHAQFILRGARNPRTWLEDSMLRAICDGTFNQENYKFLISQVEEGSFLTSDTYAELASGYQVNWHLSSGKGRSSGLLDVLFSKKDSPRVRHLYVPPASFSLIRLTNSTSISRLDTKTREYVIANSKEGNGHEGRTVTKLIEIWRQLLGLSGPIDTEESFFALGGHSLLAARMASIISREFGIVFAIRDVFVLQTVTAMAKQISALVPAHDTTRIGGGTPFEDPNEVSI
jgi:SAM-dependent methyltransferase/acyl carrier protein